MKKRKLLLMTSLLALIVLMTTCLVACDGIIVRVTMFDFEERLKDAGYDVRVDKEPLGHELWVVFAQKHLPGENKDEVVLRYVKIIRYDSVSRAEVQEDIAINEGKKTYRRGDILIVATDDDAIKDALGK